MPMTIMESMSCKSCVISTKTGGGKKLIDNSKTGLLFDIGDSDKLSKLIIMLIEDKEIREKLATNAFEYIKRYEIENIAKKWDAVLV
jgi:glycosyltransferase involved in cell wall biosynthesis